MTRSREAGAHPDRRLHPRVHDALTAHTILSDGKVLKLPMQNIGLDSVQVGCNERDMRRVETKGWPALNGETVEVGLRVELPTEGKVKESLEATCRLMYKRRITEKRYCLGMKFTDLEAGCRDILIRYLLDAP